MIKRFAPWLGVLLLAVIGIYIAAFGTAPFDSTVIVVSGGGMVLSASLLLVGGLRDSIRIGSRTIEWHVLVGVAYILLAVAVIISFFDASLLEGGVVAWVMAGAALLGGGSLVWFGVQIARDSRHVDLDAEPSNVRVVGVVLFAVASLLAGVALWSFVLR